MRYPSTYQRPSTTGVVPILGTLREKTEEASREVPNPYPAAYDTPHKY
jgi:hypothetical protein